MKIKDMVVGGVYAYQKSPTYDVARRVVLVSKETYRETDSRERRYQTGVGPFVKHGRGDKRPHSTFTLRTGLLVLRVSDDVDLDEVRRITVDDVVGDTARYRNANGVSVEVVQPRYLMDEWESFEADRIAYEKRQAEHQRQQAERKADEFPRMQEVIRVLELLNGNHYWRISEYSDNSTLEVKLKDLEALVEIAKHVLPTFRSENATD